jgi:hypothetical protein
MVIIRKKWFSYGVLGVFFATASSTTLGLEKSSSSTSWLGLVAARLGSTLRTSLFLWLMKKSEPARLGSVQLASWLVARPNNNSLHKILISI